jgi:hypothetical protein
MPLFFSYLSGSYVFITGRRAMTDAPGKKLPAAQQAELPFCNGISN